MKVAINRCYGGFGVSLEGVMRYAELKGITLYPYFEYEDSSLVLYYTKPEEERADQNDGFWDEHVWYRDRSDPLLIQVIEELGVSANGPYSDLKIVEIPDNAEYEINDYNGVESIHEAHRTWY